MYVFSHNVSSMFVTTILSCSAYAGAGSMLTLSPLLCHIAIPTPISKATLAAAESASHNDRLR